MSHDFCMNVYFQADQLTSVSEIIIWDRRSIVLSTSKRGGWREGKSRFFPDIQLFNDDTDLD